MTKRKSQTKGKLKSQKSEISDDSQNSKRILKPEETISALGKEKPVWLKFSGEDVEAIVLKLSKQGLSSEKIGLVLRDTYGIPTTKILGKKISQILKENKIEGDADLRNLEKKQELIKKHLEKNKQDKKTGRALTIINARIYKLKKYKKR